LTGAVDRRADGRAADLNPLLTAADRRAGGRAEVVLKATAADCRARRSIP
jgi:hypothetical protein